MERQRRDGSAVDLGPVGGDGAEAGRQHVRGSALLVLGRVVAMVIGMATQVVIVRTLTKSDYGAFAYALALAAAARTLLSLGQGRLLSRFLATYEEERDYPRLFGAIALAVGTICATSVLAIGGLYLFSDQLVGSALNSQDAIKQFGRPEYEDWIANNPLETPLQPSDMVTAFKIWDEQVGGSQIKK